MYKHHADPHAQSNVDVLEADILITLAKKTIRLQKYNKIIDVGCGLGFLTNRIRNELKINDVTGLDISKTAVNKAKRNFKNIKFFEYDLGKTENKNSNASIKQFLNIIHMCCVDDIILNLHVHYITLLVSSIDIFIPNDIIFSEIRSDLNFN